LTTDFKYCVDATFAARIKPNVKLALHLQRASNAQLTADFKLRAGAHFGPAKSEPETVSNADRNPNPIISRARIWPPESELDTVSDADLKSELDSADECGFGNPNFAALRNPELAPDSERCRN
jgi:hypothetical protein